MVLSGQIQLFRHVDDHLSAYIEDWHNFSTLLGQSSTPSRSLQVMQALLQRCHMSAHVLDTSYPLIYGELLNSTPYTLLFYHHYDRQLPAMDALASIAAFLAALDAYQAVIGPLPVNIKWLLDGAGKKGYSLLDTIAQFRADGCLWHEDESLDDETAVLVLGTKGLLCVEMETQTASIDLPSEHGAIVPNALWRLLWALNSLKDSREEVIIEGFYDNLIPAADNMVEVLRTMPDNAEALVQRWGVKHMLSGLQGFQLHYTHLLIPTCTVNALSGGSIPLPTTLSMLIPAQARARVDFHLVPDQDPHAIFAKLQSHLQTQGFDDVQLRMLYASQPASTPLTDPFVQMVRRATTSAYGREPRILPMTAGSYPIAPLRQLDMPVVIITTGRPQGEAGRPQGIAHAHDVAWQQDFAAQIKQIALIIEELANGTDTIERA